MDCQTHRQIDEQTHIRTFTPISAWSGSWNPKKKSFPFRICLSVTCWRARRGSRCRVPAVLRLPCVPFKLSWSVLKLSEGVLLKLFWGVLLKSCLEVFLLKLVWGRLLKLYYECLQLSWWCEVVLSVSLNDVLKLPCTCLNTVIKMGYLEVILMKSWRCPRGFLKTHLIFLRVSSVCL